MNTVYSKKNLRVFVSDLEGPISKNDNAFELATHFIPKGGRFFALVSKYDDILADVLKKPGYKAGDTLRLILPFLKAHGASNKKIKHYSSEHILLVPGAAETLKFVNDMMPSYIVSTSYEQFVFSLCDLIGFPRGNVYCTRLNMDKYGILEEEITLLHELSNEISALPMIEIPEDAHSLNDFSKDGQKTIGRLNEIFWNELSKTKSGRMLDDINPVGGSEKARAVHDVVERCNSQLSNVMYVGDSITDVSALQLVRRNGGLTVSFNGNQYAVREAEIAVLSHNTVVTSVLADVFFRLGKDGVLRLVEDWGSPSLGKYVSAVLKKRITALYPTDLPKIEKVTVENRERLSNTSTAFRKSVRGEAIGKLG